MRCWWLGLGLCAFAAHARAEQVLAAVEARLMGESIRMQQGRQAAFWKSGESVEWRFDAADAGSRYIHLDYSSQVGADCEILIDGVKAAAAPLAATRDWEIFQPAVLGPVDVTAGSHTLRVIASRDDGLYCLNLRAVSIRSEKTPVPPAKFGCLTVAKGSPVVLNPVGAVLNPGVKMWRTSELRNWSRGGSAEWAFELPEELAGQYLLITYSAPEDISMDVGLNGSAKPVPMRATDGWGEYRTAVLDTVDLPAGTNTLKLTNSRPGNFIRLKKVEFTSKTPPPFSLEYPPVYIKKEDWARTMSALRIAFSRPEIEASRMHYGKQIDRYLSRKDGRALWDDFPVETDWFLQDNQVHGEWGRGVYDARKDYRHYLDPNRDSALEQALIAQVLPELGPRSMEFRAQLDALVAQNCPPGNPAWLQLYVKACRERRTHRLSALVEKTDRLIYATHMNMGTIYLATETQGCPDGSQLRMIDLSPEADGQFLKDELLFDSGNGIVRDPEVSFDGRKLLFAWRKTNKHLGTVGNLAPATDNYKIYEMDLATRGLRALTDDRTYGADFEPCYLPNGDIMFSSVRCVQEVTCGWGDGSNLFVMDGDGQYARRVGFDQTQTGFPHLLNDGRVVYTRRDYNDRGQSYAHALFVMNPDGTQQTEYYGNNSMAPTSIQHTRPIPGTGRAMGVAGGYHTSQGGKLVVIDPKKGSQNYEGLDFHNWEPTPLEQISDENYCRVGEQYCYPYPLDERSLVVSLEPIGAYLTRDNGHLDASREQGVMLYKLYFMTLDGRRELLAAHPTLSCVQAVPVMARRPPAARASTVDYTRETGVCYVQNVYYGPSAEGIKPGSVKKLRVVELFYKPITIGAGGWSPNRAEVGPGRKYAGYGWHSVLPAGVGSASFDTKEILGEVDVHADGSAMFEVPARTPVFFQLIDEHGLTVQTMRSWATLMPGENFSCVGCHEENNSAPLPQAMKTIALQNPPQKLQPVPLITGRSFSYPVMVQPVFDRHCADCHAPGKKAESIDLTATLVKDNENDDGSNSTRRQFNRSYLTLLKVQWDTSNGRTRGPRLDEGRPNEWVSYYTRMATTELTPPYYAGSTRSKLINMMQNGHGKTRVSPEEIAAVAAWIDLNVPFVGEYDEMNIWDEATVARYNEKLGMRRKMEAIEAENINAFVEAGQP